MDLKSEATSESPGGLYIQTHTTIPSRVIYLHKNLYLIIKYMYGPNSLAMLPEPMLQDLALISSPSFNVCHSYPQSQQLPLVPLISLVHTFITVGITK